MRTEERILREKLALCIEKLRGLGDAEQEEIAAQGGEAVGFFRRDFGIREWDWPQGVGLYGILKLMEREQNEEYRTFLHEWFTDNIREGLPSRNINTTMPLLTLVSLTDELPAADKGGGLPACHECEWRPAGGAPE